MSEAATHTLLSVRDGGMRFALEAAIVLALGDDDTVTDHLASIVGLAPPRATSGRSLALHAGGTTSLVRVDAVLGLVEVSATEVLALPAPLGTLWPVIAGIVRLAEETHVLLHGERVHARLATRDETARAPCAAPSQHIEVP